MSESDRLAREDLFREVVSIEVPDDGRPRFECDGCSLGRAIVYPSTPDHPEEYDFECDGFVGYGNDGPALFYQENPVSDDGSWVPCPARENLTLNARLRLLEAVAEAARWLAYTCTAADIECCEGAVAGGDADCSRCQMHALGEALAALAKQVGKA